MGKTFNTIGSVNGGLQSILSVTTENGTATSVTATNGTKTVNLTAQVILPSGYTQLEYLESTGTQRIDTGITPTSNSKVSVVFSGFTQSGSYTIAGSDNGWTNSGFMVGYYSVFNNNVWTAALIADGERHTVDLSASGMYADGALRYGPFSSSFTGTPFSLFCLNRNGDYQEYSNVKIYSCKLYQTENTISRNLIPAKRNSDSVLGMYDTVNDVFYTNAGTGTFIAGPPIPFTAPISSGTWTITATDGSHTNTRDIVVDLISKYDIIIKLPTLPDEYTQIEWVIGQINTGYEPVSACRIFGKQQSLRSSSETSYWDKWFGANISGAQIIYLELQDSKLRYYNSTTYGGISFERDVSTIYTYSTSGRTITINGSDYTVTSGDAITSTFGKSLTCGMNKVKTWYFRITAPDTVTFVRDYYPAIRKSDSAIGMYDIINGTFTECDSGSSGGPAVVF